MRLLSEDEQRVTHVRQNGASASASSAISEPSSAAPCLFAPIEAAGNNSSRATSERGSSSTTVCPSLGLAVGPLLRNTHEGDAVRRAANARRQNRPLVAAFVGIVLVLYVGIACAIYLAVSAIV